MTVWTYYMLSLHLMLKTYVDPMVEYLERGANQTKGTDPAPPANFDHDFPARLLDAREDYWTNDIFYQNTTPATDDIYQNYTLAIDRLLDDYL